MAEPSAPLRSASSTSDDPKWSAVALLAFALANVPLAYAYAARMSALAPYGWIAALPAVGICLLVLGRTRFSMPTSNAFAVVAAFAAAILGGASAWAESLWASAALAWCGLATAAFAVGGTRWLFACSPALAVLACGVRMPADLDGRLLTLWNGWIAAAAGKVLDLAGVYYASHHGVFLLGGRRAFVEEGCLGAAWLLPAFAGAFGYALASRASRFARIVAALSAPIWVAFAAVLRTAVNVYFSATRGSATDAPMLAAGSGVLAMLLAWLLAMSFLQLLSAFSPRRRPVLDADTALRSSGPSTASAILLLGAVAIGGSAIFRIATDPQQFFLAHERSAEHGQAAKPDEFGLIDRREFNDDEHAVAVCPTAGGLEELRRCYLASGWNAGPMRVSVVRQPGVPTVVIGEISLTNPLGGRNALSIAGCAAVGPMLYAPHAGQQTVARKLLEGASASSAEERNRARDAVAAACRAPTKGPQP